MSIFINECEFAVSVRITPAISLAPLGPPLFSETHCEMCLCPGERFDRLGRHLDKELAALVGKLQLGAFNKDKLQSYKEDRLQSGDLYKENLQSAVSIPSSSAPVEHSGFEEDVEESSNFGELRSFLGSDPAIHAYELGDLAPEYWPHCRWHVLRDRSSGCLVAVALTYTGLQVPCVQLMASDGGQKAAQALVVALLHGPRYLRTLPSFECHLSIGLDSHLRDAGLEVTSRPHLRMAKLLEAPAEGKPVSADGLIATQLGLADGEAALELCTAAMDRTWFEPHVLASGSYFGVWAEDARRLVCIGGTHVISNADKVAALGNVCTAASHRRQGLAKRLVKVLCGHLHGLGVRVVALNVEQGNEAAARLYASLGFYVAAHFIECDVQQREPQTKPGEEPVFI